MSMPLMVRAMCTQQDPDNAAVFVMLVGTGSIIGAVAPDATATSIPVRVLFQGPADPFRINMQPLPQPGQYGIVCFPLGDIRSGLWLGSYIPIAADSLPGEAGNPDAAYLKYFSSFSGYWDYLDVDGKYTNQFPDRASLVIGADLDIPTVYRNIVDENQLRIQEEFTMDDRVAEPPDAPFELQYTHGAGTQVSVDSGGNLFVFGATDTDLLDRALAEPAALDVVFAGTTFAIGGGDPANVGSDLPIVPVATPGDMNMIGNMTPVASWTVTFAGATIQIDHSGNVSIDSPGTISLTAAAITMAAASITVDSSGAVDIASAGDVATTIDGRVFVLHVHDGVTSGTAISGPIV